MENIYRLSILFYGHVQGVGFRASVYKTVQGWNIHGFVENCEDGSVLVIMEGTKIQATHLIEQMKAAFFITKIEVSEQVPLHNLPCFFIKDQAI